MAQLICSDTTEEVEQADGAGADGQLPEALQKIEPAMLELVCNEVVESGGRVAWDDIAGQEQAKRLIQELVVWPMKNPDLFKVTAKQTWLSPHL